MRLPIALLGLVLVLMLLLSGQAFQAIRTHDETATGVLRDYARLVIDEYTRRAMGSVGYYGYYTAINELRVAIQKDADFPHSVDKPEAGTQAARARQLVQTIVFANVTSGEVRANDPFQGERREYFVRRSGELAGEPLPESGLVIEHVELDGEQHTFVLSSINDGNVVFGFEVDLAAVADWLAESFDNGPLLPQSLAGDTVGNAALFLEHKDAGGDSLFEAGADPDPYLLAVRNLDDEYGGIFRGHSVSAAIDSDVAESLIIGGLPRSRLPLLLTLVLLTLVLLVAALRQMRREYAVMQMRSDFVAEVSHELRTPLTQIRMFSETLLLDRVRSDGDRRRALEIIGREAQRLGHLVENVLRFSRAEKEAQEFELISQQLAPVIESVVEEFRPIAAAADMRITVAADETAQAAIDQDALRQALLNLLDNAVKYGPPGQEICVELACDASTARIAVSDEGAGIPPQSRDEIWKPYTRLPREREAAIAGTGIGLSVVHDIVQRLGGRVYVDAATENGARFVIELPQ